MYLASSICTRDCTVFAIARVSCVVVKLFTFDACLLAVQKQKSPVYNYIRFVMETVETISKTVAGGDPSQALAGAHQMSLFNQIVYIVLVLEITIYLFITIVPLTFIPISVRKKAISAARAFLNNRQISFFFQFIMLICVLLLSDTIRRLVHLERVSAKHDANPVVDTTGCAALKVFSDKFYAQRNLYLSGFSVFMVLVLHQRLSDIYVKLDLQERNEHLGKEIKKMKIQAARLNDDPIGALSSSAPASNNSTKISTAESTIDAALADALNEKTDLVELRERKKVI
ncbi:hypothetical protein SeMB42_g01893 [Synchytrium endobioticum]|uniref:Endoplasmic reticulum transmembrane protein n=1 Tax=Synchytrium endobioticum TaxID=286115 RepID=A0A507DK11_9FUNG|nr:hypothetical protein SeMB42_g01893 [Synchytrium endobioticum]